MEPGKSTVLVVGTDLGDGTWGDIFRREDRWGEFEFISEPDLGEAVKQLEAGVAVVVAPLGTRFGGGNSTDDSKAIRNAANKTNPPTPIVIFTGSDDEGRLADAGGCEGVREVISLGEEGPVGKLIAALRKIVAERANAAATPED